MECVHKKQYRGMTLIELLISLALSSMLAMMIVNAFLLIKKNMLTQQALVRMQVNARSIDYLLGKALRNSGVFGCQKLQSYSHLIAHKDIHLFNYGLIDSKGIKGLLPKQLSTSFPSVHRILSRCKRDSDLLWIQAGNEHFVYERLKPDSVLVLSDCRYLHFFRKQNEPIPKLTKADTLSRLSSIIYYVGDTKRFNARGRPIYALYSTDYNDRTLELVEGVIKLELTYGTLREGTLIYQPADEVTDWYAIVSVRLKALLNTVEETEPLMTKWWYFEWPLM